MSSRARRLARSADARGRLATSEGPLHAKDVTFTTRSPVFIDSRFREDPPATEIKPPLIPRSNEFDLPRTTPAFDFLLTCNGLLDVVETFNVDQIFTFILF